MSEPPSEQIGEARQIVRAADEHAAKANLPAAVGVSHSRRSARAGSPHSHKFLVAIGALVGIGVAAIVVAVSAAVNHTSTKPTPQWSAWQPGDSGTLGAREIADHIAPTYRISATDQLDVITVVNLANATASAAATQTGSATPNGLQVAVQFDPSNSQVSLLSGNTIAYNMCGVGGKNCAIGIGQPSADRLLLLRREALELALYTFKYIGGVQNVVAILPPGHTEQTSTLTSKPPASGSKASTSKPLDIAVLFIKDGLKPLLSQPLRNTFPEEFPPTVAELPAWRNSDEAGLVDQITAHGLFTERLVQAQDGSNLIVLNPLPPQ